MKAIELLPAVKLCVEDRSDAEARKAHSLEVKRSVLGRHTRLAQVEHFKRSCRHGYEFANHQRIHTLTLELCILRMLPAIRSKTLFLANKAINLDWLPIP